MGVKRLRGFFDKNPQLLQNYLLHNTRIVIDGNNLLFFLYFRHKIPVVFGGEYLRYENVVRDFFQKLESCDVLPFVIFDGCDDISDRKVETILARMEDRIRTVKALNRGSKGQILPPVAKQTFLGVLDELGIPHATCQMEADEEIAALANAWDCPVLSNDSDFFVFPLRRGLVLLDTLRQQKRQPGKDTKKKHCRLIAKLYKLTHLKKHFPGTDASSMALMATLQGNDYIDSADFRPVFAKCSLFHVPKGQTQSDKAHANMAILLRFCGREKNLDNVIKYLVGFIPTDQRNIEVAIRHSIDSYTNLSSKKLSCLASNRLLVRPIQMSAQDALQSWKGVPLPDWFLSALSSTRISTHPFDAIVNRRVFLCIQVDDTTQTSSFGCALPIRELMYGILLSLDRDRIPKQTQDFHVTEYDRGLEGITSEPIQADFTLRNGSAVPSVKDIPSMPLHLRREVYENVMGIHNVVQPAPSDIHFLLSVIAFWVRCARPNLIQLYALWLGFLKLSVITPLAGKGQDIKTRNNPCTSGPKSVSETGRKSSQETTQRPPIGVLGAAGGDHVGLISLDVLKQLCSRTHCETAITRIDRFIQGKKTGKKHIPILTHVHVFAQFQSIYKAALDLNGVLDCPLSPTSMTRIFQGTFLHSMSEKLNESADPLGDILTMLGHGGPLATWYQNAMVQIQNWVAYDDAITTGTGTIIKSKRSKNRRKRRTKNVQSAGEDKTTTRN